MEYLFFQILVWILLAFGVGGVFGWLLRGFTHALQEDNSPDGQPGRRGDDHIMVALLKSELGEYKARLKALENTPPASPDTPAEKPKPETPEAWRPEGLPGPKGEADDLKRIRGVGPKIEKTLNALGIYHYYQIAALSRENILWLNNHLHFPGRIEREAWVKQTRELVKNSIDQPDGD